MRSAIIVKGSVAMIMHLLLFWIHMGTLKINNPNAFDIFFPRIIVLAIANVIIIADFANSAVSLKQPSNKIQCNNHCDAQAHNFYNTLYIVILAC